MNGQTVTVIGVLQPAPYFPDQVDCFLNMVFSEHHLSATMVEGRTHRMTELIARLAPGATLDQARTEITTIHARLQRGYPDAYDPGSHYRVAVIPFKQALGEPRPAHAVAAHRRRGVHPRSSRPRMSPTSR